MNRFNVLLFVFACLFLSGVAVAGVQYSEKLLARALKMANKSWEDQELGMEALPADPGSEYFSSRDSLY